MLRRSRLKRAQRTPSKHFAMKVDSSVLVERVGGFEGGTLFLYVAVC